ncbi:restriction endonuclease subunit S [Escherichia coli]|nr:restriction endonuclease subunit S [Escherichia coli]HAN8489038.1 specificity determinant for hsdM and hsdR [Escherichia coli]HAV8507790.1 specificity determinant for hsdM and hsdR [Escherichia coli]HAV8517505.1 specificity determinant for hsdM and hsdR [Escherichia coli]HBB9634794.1 restriction endonuclease subunit S [Escherichia coli]
MSEKTRPESWLSKIAIDCFEQISTTNNKVKSTACSPHGLYPVIDQGQNYISGYINDESKLIKITTPICIFGDHTRIIKWVEHNFVPGADGTKLLKPKDFIYPRYAYYSLCALNIPDKGYSRHFKYFKELKIDIPAWEEQKIIAEKLDTLLAQVDSTKVRLEQIPQILKRFRQAVLGAAVSGKLTEYWRNEQGVNFSTWENTFFEKICTEITVGYVGKMLDRYQNEGIPFLRSQNVREFKFSDKNLLYISEKFHKEIFKSRLTPGDLAIVRSGAPGTTCVIPDSLPIANCSDLVIARPSEKLNSDFGCIFMNSNIAKINVSENRVGIAQQHFNVGSMKKMPIHLPPLTEQHEIVRRVEQLFAYADTIEKQVNNALARVNNLTQSILAKAFRGELTAQWRAENPELISGENSAAALLEKIKAERAASGGKKASRKKS